MKLLTNIWNAIICFFKKLFGIKKDVTPDTSADESELENVVEDVDGSSKDSTEDTEMVENPNEEESKPKDEETVEDELDKGFGENVPKVEDDGCPDYVITHKKISDNRYQFYVNIN